MLNIYGLNPVDAYYSPTNARAGFDSNGEPCITYNPNGNDECPFRVEIRLIDHQLVNGAWVDTLRFGLKYRPLNQKTSFNPAIAEFNFQISRNVDIKSAESACLAINGTYYPDTNKCSIQLTKTSTACQTGYTYSGPEGETIDNVSGGTSSDTHCTQKVVLSQACQTGTVIKGFDEQGRPICGAAL